MTENEQEIIKTTKRLIATLEVVYNKPGLLFWQGFIRGVGYGLGATIGAALVILFLSWLLQQFVGIPNFADWAKQLNQNLLGK
jgi:hypothetical protein